MDGSILIGGTNEKGASDFAAVDPSSGAELAPRFANADAGHVDRACALADQAFATYGDAAPEVRAGLLEAIAEEIEAIGDALIVRAMQETGLPRPRLEGERGRTTGQLRLFASFVRSGDWAHATLDSALPDRAPLPRPDLRRRHVAVGPVAVFGASNFPLAFSVAGGDTASALAAGCPVVVKGHPAHPGTGELVARAVQAAVRRTGLPEGVFSYLPGVGNALGSALVADPRIKAVGFTGSRGGGLALVGIAAARPEPIPVYAEMSSVNPVLLFPAALAARAEALGAAFIQSLTMGAGQFCTNPGIVIALSGPDLDRFTAAAAAALAESRATPMLSPGIYSAYETGVAALAGHPSVETIARGCVGEGINQGRGALFATDVARFKADAALGHEVFGASSVIVRCADFAEMAELVQSLEGQLTATLHLDAADEDDARPFVPLLARKAGRILANGWPTGVEVSHAMVHGGPYPATSDGRTTSVGTLAIERFLRPVCYQGLPSSLLPEALADGNPWKLLRTVDGKPVLAG
ncbi:aldehyde dehydrogenase (NADP(+)) [Sphingomonas sp. XMGL2]|uniref:Aldehyde dehydrogenase (NADP(+)) n=1 Tax=Sphingomonas quercus TaxID=2842451 RepID=A0ABS6BMW0_9SPHN|nr:aldehyde dehydrogenase (NADP(+)) [Sphingomonas quercus]